MACLPWLCPHDVADSHKTSEFFEQHFYDISAMPFPEEVRKFGETVILGRKRKESRKVNYGHCPYDWLEKRMADSFVYKLPAGRATAALPQDGTHRYRVGPTGRHRARYGFTSSGQRTSWTIGHGRR